MTERREPTWEDDVLPMIRRQVLDARAQGLQPYRLRITDGALRLLDKWCDHYGRFLGREVWTSEDRGAYLQLDAAGCEFSYVVVRALDVPAIVDSIGSTSRVRSW